MHQLNAMLGAGTRLAYNLLKVHAGHGFAADHIDPDQFDLVVGLVRNRYR